MGWAAAANAVEFLTSMVSSILLMVLQRELTAESTEDTEKIRNA
jgi:hypothetical protein